MKKLLLISASVLLLSGCTDAKGSIEAIKNTGLEPVKVGGYSWFACSEKDWFHTKFTAKRADGTIVSGVVCKGLLFKGKTVRFD